MKPFYCRYNKILLLEAAEELGIEVTASKTKVQIINAFCMYENQEDAHAAVKLAAGESP
jgi:hypothetical protein